LWNINDHQHVHIKSTTGHTLGFHQSIKSKFSFRSTLILSTHLFWDLPWGFFPSEL
jgi:hypothetical protein